jgi:hypothetical protein
MAKAKSGGTGRNIYQDGPHLQSALLCERVLVEQDGVKSAIRNVDRFTRTAVVKGGVEENIPPLILRPASRRTMPPPVPRSDHPTRGRSRSPGWIVNSLQTAAPLCWLPPETIRRRRPVPHRDPGHKSQFSSESG